MTSRKHLKRLVRTRAAKTGESYTTALRHLRSSKEDALVAATVAIELAHNTAVEERGEARLTEVLTRWDLAKYVYTARVRIDGDAAASANSPVLTFAPRDLVGDIDVALSVFLNLQLERAAYDLRGGLGAWQEAEATWPDPPDADHGGAESARRTWFLVQVCALEYAAMAELVGEERARHVLAAKPTHSAIYARVLANPAETRAYLDRNDLVLPDDAPASVEPGTVIELGSPAPLATLVTGNSLELTLAGRLQDLHGRYDLRRWRMSDAIRLTSVGRPGTKPVPTMSSQFATEPEADVLMNYVQLQASYWAQTLDVAILEGLCGTVIDDVIGARNEIPRELLLAVVLACAIALDATRSVLGTDAAHDAIERHPRNRQIYEHLETRLDAFLAAAAIAGAGLP